MSERADDQRFVRLSRVAERWDVSVKTVRAWADKGVLRVTRTPGGHRRVVDDENAKPAQR